jgi:hypothetical protein
MEEPQTPEQVRATVERLVNQRGESYAAMSRFIGRNAAYLQQFVKRGTPERLPEKERLMLAKYFGVDERRLGARDPWTPRTADQR